MGLMVGAHITPSDHLGIQSSRDVYDVLAPADGFIVAIQHRTMPTLDPANPGAKDEYQVIIEHSCTFWTFIDLVNQLDTAILRKTGVIPGGPPRFVRIPVASGQAIGVVRGRHGIDFAVVNSEVTLPGFIVPDHYNRSPAKIHTVDPFEYYAEPLRSAMLALDPRKAPPRGGKIDFDKDGRLVGNWFLEGTNGYSGSGDDPRLYWKGHLSIVYNHIDPSKITISIGDYDGSPRQFWVIGNAPDPADVTTDSRIVKYELVWPGMGGDGQTYAARDERIQGVMLAQVLPGRKMRAEFFPGKTAVDVKEFTTRARIFER